ncbi:MAG: von Willebrand factor type domain protein [Ignavibacteria bacterium]|nr:von Willebrand factor type domain protein [Ignavibacteria bacterium]
MKKSIYIFALLIASFLPVFGQNNLPRIDIQALLTDFGYVDFMSTGYKQIIVTNISDTTAKLYYYQPIISPFSGTIPLYDTLLRNESKIFNVSYTPKKLGIDNQRVFFRAENRTSNSVALLFDISGSMNEMMNDGIVKLTGAKQAGRSFVDSMKNTKDVKDEAAIYSFSTIFTISQAFTTNKPSLRTAINNLTARGNTAFYDALDSTCSLISSRTFTKVIVALTDGMDNSSNMNLHSPDIIIAKAKARNIRIFTIGLGSPVDDFTLTKIAVETDGAYFKARSSKELSDIYNKIFRLLTFDKQFYFDLAGRCKGPFSELTCGKDSVFNTGDTSKFEFYIGNLTRKIKLQDQYKILLRFNPNVLKPVIDSGMTYNYDGMLTLRGQNTVNLDSLPLTSIRFTQMLGNERCANLQMDSLVWNEGEIITLIKNGNCTVCTKTCDVEGTRLFLSKPNSELFLAQNIPNPCNISTTVDYGLMEEGYTSFSVFNSLGVEVYRTNDIPKKPGKYSLPIDVGTFPQGIYFYILKTPSGNLSNRMQVIK